MLHSPVPAVHSLFCKNNYTFSCPCWIFLFFCDFTCRLKIFLIVKLLHSSPEKGSLPSTNMICLGIEVDSDNLSLSVPQSRVQELLDELTFWSHRSQFTLKQLQSLLGKLLFVTVCVKLGRIFMSLLILNNLCTFPRACSRRPVSEDMRADIAWWSQFLPLFNGVLLIKPNSWDFSDLQFATNASLSGGGANHISSLELYTIVVPVLGSRASSSPVYSVLWQWVHCHRHQLGLFQGQLHATLSTTTVVFRLFVRLWTPSSSYSRRTQCFGRCFESMTLWPLASRNFSDHCSQFRQRI